MRVLTFLSRIFILIAFSSLIVICFLLDDFSKQENQLINSYQQEIPLFKTLMLYNQDYKKLSLLQRYQIKKIILGQIHQLRRLGWTDTTISHHYLLHLQLTTNTGQIDNNYLTWELEQSQLIGSPIFNQLWKGQNQTTNQENAKESLSIFLRILHFPKTIDQFPENTQSFLQYFDPNLRPTDTFWDELSKTVQIAFPDEALSQEDSFAKQIHHVRYLISLQQINWIRTYYQHTGETDAQAFARYLSTLNETDYTLEEPARYHNKVSKKTDETGQIVGLYPDNVIQHNFKILIHFHSEFILSNNGQFLVALDTSQSKENPIINSASFNYADQNDTRHNQLDILPIDNQDPYFITTMLANNGNPYLTPSLDEQKDKENLIFSYDGKSSKQLTKIAIQHFETLLKSYQH